MQNRKRGKEVTFFPAYDSCVKVLPASHKQANPIKKHPDWFTFDEIKIIYRSPGKFRELHAELTDTSANELLLEHGFLPVPAR
jgi:hypothetical protein